MVERERWSRKKKAKGLVDLVDFDVCRRVLGLERREMLHVSLLVYFFFSFLLLLDVLENV